LGLITELNKNKMNIELELNRTINMLMAHPDNEPDSEFADRIDSLIELKQKLIITDVMQEFNSLIVRLVELLSVKYPNRQINNEFVDNLKTVWKGNELGLKANIEALEKELNFA
jgi:hypothetical protein